MKSLFPGMDPFLEQPAYWSDFHVRFINYWCEAIAELLPPSYEATLGERVYLVECDSDERKLGYPDIAVTHDEARSRARHDTSAPAATLEPVIIPVTMLEGLPYSPPFTNGPGSFGASIINLTFRRLSARRTGRGSTRS